jgi:hypothetical protein
VSKEKLKVLKEGNEYFSIAKSGKESEKIRKKNMKKLLGRKERKA